MLRFSSFGAVVVSGDYWNLAPYIGASHLWGEYWGHLGTMCWKRSRDFADGVGNGDVDVVFWVVPINVQPVVIAIRWVNGDGVMLS